LEKSVSTERLTGGGENIADVVIANFTELGVPCASQATDNACDVSVTCAKVLKLKYVGFVRNGCVLHVNNLTLMNAYHATFGYEEMGVCSALRVGYIMNYLMGLEGHLDRWKVPLSCLYVMCISSLIFFYQVWANENGFENIAFKACGASKGRWWSVVQSFSDVYLHRAAYRGWCEHMAKALGTSCTYQHIYVETTSWLQNDKVICDLSFVLAFHEE